MNSVQKIHQQALVCAKRFLQNQVELIEILTQVIQFKVHAHLGFSSVFEYCTLELKLSSDQACSFIAIARKSIEIPEIKTLVEQGELTVTNARRIVPHIDKQNKSFWLEKATSLSQRELEKEIVKVKPAAAVQERIKPVAANLNSLLILISDEDEQLWNRAQEVLLQKHRSKMEKREVLKAALTALLEKEDPLARAKRIEEKKQSRQSKPTEKTSSTSSESRQKSENGDSQKKPRTHVPARTIAPSMAHAPSRTQTFPRTHIPSPVARQVMLRDRGQCTHMHNGMRCSSRVFLQVHHRLPVALGGANTLENLVTLCSSHHRQVHDVFDLGPTRRAPGDTPLHA